MRAARKGRCAEAKSYRTASLERKNPETAKAPCGRQYPESAVAMMVLELPWKRWIVAAL
jgi:hypothetical protein